MAPSFVRCLPRLHLKGLGACLSLALFAGCGDVEPHTPLVLSEPVALDEHLVWLDASNQRALVLDVAGADPQPHVTSIDLKGVPGTTQRQLAHNALLSLTANPDSDDADLVVLTSSGVKTRYALGTQFDTLTQSADGNFAIAHFSEAGASTKNASLLFNPNEIAIVDLTRTGNSAVTKRTLRSFGTAPRLVAFSPKMQLAGEERQLAVVLFGSQIALLDLNYPDRPEYTIELSRGASITLSQVRFSAEDQKIYLLANGSNDVYVLRLLPAGGNRENDFEPSLNQLGADAAPQDMVVFEGSLGSRLLVASGTRAEIVEASSSRVTQIPLSTRADRILLFHGTSPFDDADEPRALLFAVGQSSVSFLDLEEAEERTTRNLETLAVPGGIQQLIPLNDNLVLIPQTSGGLTILNLEERTASPIQARLGLAAIQPSLATGRLWATSTGSKALGYIDVDNLHPGEVRLDYEIQRLFVLDKAKRVVAVHSAPEGLVSILNANDPEDLEQATTLQGFFFEGILDR
jgi:hypothetical protein